MNTPASTSLLADRDRLLTASQVAHLLGVHLSTVRRWIRDEQLPAYRVGDKGVRVRAGDVSRLISPLRARPEQPDGKPGQVNEAGRRLTAEERQRGLAILAELEQLDGELSDEFVGDSTELIQRMREERTAELLGKLGA